jgi:hypothetical protein
VIVNRLARFVSVVEDRGVARESWSIYDPGRVSEHVEIQVPTGTVKVGRGAKIPADTSPAVIEEIRRLLLAEDAMLSVAMWASSHPTLTGHPLDRRTRMVSAAGMATTFWRPFSADNKGKRLDPAEWRARIEDDPKQAEMFDRLELRRNTVLAHSDTDAGAVNVTDTYNFLAGRNASRTIRWCSGSMTLARTRDCLKPSRWR